MFSFAWPWVFALLVLPFIARLFKAKNASPDMPLYLPTFGLVADSVKPISRGGFPWFTYLIWILLVSAAAKPQWLGDPITIPQEGREMMLAVDLSGSMDEKDMVIGRQQVNRLTMLKYVLNDFIERRVGDRLGLILFADTAYVQTPLTYDRATVKQLLNEAVLGLVGEKTAIGDALGLAAKRFNEKGESNRILILLTDGQNTAGNIEPLEALEIAKEAGVRVYTIGIGADEMMVRSIFGTRKVNPSADLDENLLTQIAEQTGGKYFRARDTEELQKIYELLDELEPVEDDPIQLRPQQALFHFPLGLALLLSFLTTLFPLLQHYLAKLGINKIRGEDQ
ncbi:VWA domain-containing protein [Psychrosphaera sp. 1_MG-2023]|uniref:vWA domain-containing protein n=1 Tax=Psychrosphaera sp. 1_MG-2023 TaxID=3062643 RepID=UPI0026E16253|nr:VWA domain-containing protein [Psychrosphaera sp. 1_MG-2023]MDO6719499.1 VWA domain-containing protein [Psychrosphaera sp. 1_MG-2023]